MSKDQLMREIMLEVACAISRYGNTIRGANMHVHVAELNGKKIVVGAEDSSSLDGPFDMVVQIKLWARR